MRGEYFYRRIAAFLPPGILKSFKEEFTFVGATVDAEAFAGFMAVFSFLLSVGIAAIAFFAFLFPVYFSLPALFALFFGGTLLWFNLAAESEGRFVDNILPDALQLIASNIKSGLTTERSLFISAQKEFGPLALELKNVGKDILSGRRLEDALSEMPKKIKSRTLERTIWLVTKGIGSGGRLADLLLELADDLRDQKALKGEISANISIYVLLIFFSTAIGAPLLLGVSTFIVEAMHKQTSMLDAGNLAEMQEVGGVAGGQFASGGAGLPGAGVEPAFVLMFALILLAANAVFVGMTMGVINAGKEKNGIKFIPIIMGLSLIVFYATRFLLIYIFGSTLL